jgi:hypothetical protein
MPRAAATSAAVAPGSAATAATRASSGVAIGRGVGGSFRVPGGAVETRPYLEPGGSSRPKVWAGSGICPQAASGDCLRAVEGLAPVTDTMSRRPPPCSGLDGSGNQAERAALRVQEDPPTVTAGLKFGHRGAQLQPEGSRNAQPLS